MEEKIDKPINIFLVTFYFTDVIVETIKRIKDITKYPYRLIVGDNKSVNSDEIRVELKKLLNEGYIDKLYFFGENYLGASIRFLYENEEQHSDITILTDCDVYVTETNDRCWLTEYVENYSKNEKLGMLGIYTLNPNYRRKKLKQNAHKRDYRSICFDEKKNGECMCNGHLISIRTKILDSYRKKYKTQTFADGYLHGFLRRETNFFSGRLNYIECVNKSTNMLDDKYYDNLRNNIENNSRKNNKLNLTMNMEVNDFKIIEKNG